MYVCARKKYYLRAGSSNIKIYLGIQLNWFTLLTFLKFNFLEIMSLPSFKPFLFNLSAGSFDIIIHIGMYKPENTWDGSALATKEGDQ